MRTRTEAGVGTVTGVLLMGVVLTIGITCAAVIGLIGAHRRAAAAADLAALAGAQALASGADPCTAAGVISRRNGAELHHCRETGGDVMVEVTVMSPRWLGQQLLLRSRARAGPVGDGAGLAPLISGG